MRFEFVVRRGVRSETLGLEGDGTTWRLSRGGPSEILTAARLDGDRISVLLADGRQLCGRVAHAGDGEVEVVRGDGPRRVRLADPLTDRLSHSYAADSDTEEEEVRTGMPGRVLEVRVSDGDRVPAGHVLVVLEAMKMQNEIRSSRPGIVARCRVRPGEAVEGNTLLLVVQPSEDPEAAEG